ncbi:MAG: hypothetical protein KA354_08580 [Phycisphaerae bacterium]|nr:hypothetical protein [Phycisphaerae bacterium]
MELSGRLDALLTLAERVGIEVRPEPMGGGGGGLCRVKNHRILFVDTAADLATRYDRTLAAMASQPELDEHFLPPEVRDDLERQRRSAAV